MLALLRERRLWGANESIMIAALILFQRQGSVFSGLFSAQSFNSLLGVCRNEHRETLKEQFNVFGNTLICFLVLDKKVNPAVKLEAAAG